MEVREELQRRLNEDWVEINTFTRILHDELEHTELRGETYDERSYDKLLKKTLDLVAVILKGKVDAEVYTIYRKG